MASTPVLRPTRRRLLGGAALSSALVAAAVFGAASTASAATIISGPVNLGTSDSYGVLGASAVTNTGPTVIAGDVGIYPGSSITRFPPGIVNGTVHATDTEAAQAQSDALIAYDVAASLSPTQSGVTELAGLSLSPGVYRGDTIALSSGTLTLAGDAQSVWVFQTSSTLTVGSATQILITGGASACNVFWQVGSSASLGTAAAFQGTVLAQQSITATTDATVQGRLLALNAAVTLDSNVITAPTDCPPTGTVSDTDSPVITSGAPPTATAGTPYSFTVTATGTPAPTFTATGLPAGLVLDSATGVISGVPTAPGSSTVTVTASNGVTPTTTATYTLVVDSPAVVVPVPGEGPGTPVPPVTPVTPVTPAVPVVAAPPVGSGTGSPTGLSQRTATASDLAYTGVDSTTPLLVGSLLLLAGVGLLVAAGARRARR